MTYLDDAERDHLRRMLMVFFALPYSTDLDGKDVEKLIRVVRRVEGDLSRRKELFDILDAGVGYSVKTLFKPRTARVVDLQEQRFCDKDDLEVVRAQKRGLEDSPAAQGDVLLTYMHKRITEQMAERGIHTAKSSVLLKWWNSSRTSFQMRYWEEDFLAYVTDLCTRNANGEMRWVEQGA